LLQLELLSINLLLSNKQRKKLTNKQTNEERNKQTNKQLELLSSNLLISNKQASIHISATTMPCW